MAKQKGRWFRFYAGALDDPKVLALPDSLFRTWVSLLCVVSKNESTSGELPDEKTLTFHLRLRPSQVRSRLEKLIEAGLIDKVETLKIHNWNNRQYSWDNENAQKQKNYRDRKVLRNSLHNPYVSVSGSDSEYVTTSSDLGKNNRVDSSYIGDAREDWADWAPGLDGLQ